MTLIFVQIMHQQKRGDSNTDQEYQLPCCNRFGIWSAAVHICAPQPLKQQMCPYRENDVSNAQSLDLTACPAAVQIQPVQQIMT